MHRTALAAVLVTLLSACSAPDSGSGSATPTAGDTGGLPSHVHGVGIDPGDGTVLLATHGGLFEVGDDGRPVEVGPVIDLMGFSVTGPDHYLASGHPGPGVDLPEPVGLIETTDGGRTWTPVSRQGESDFHALTALGAAGALGWDGALRRSPDGHTWEQLAIPAEPHTLAAAPDGATVLATSRQGLLRSADAGATWVPVEGAPLLQVVAWSGDGTTAVGADPAGTLWLSTDAGGTWQQRAGLGSAPHAVAAAGTGAKLRVVVVTEEGLLESTDEGRTFRAVLAG